MGISQEDRNVTKLLMYLRLLQLSFTWLLHVVLKQVLKVYTVYKREKAVLGKLQSIYLILCSAVHKIF